MTEPLYAFSREDAARLKRSAAKSVGAEGSGSVMPIAAGHSGNVLVNVTTQIPARGVLGPGVDPTIHQVPIYDAESESNLPTTIPIIERTGVVIPIGVHLAQRDRKGNWIIDLGLEAFLFTLTADLSGASASATIKHISGSPTIETSTVFNTANLFSDLESGDSGICLKVEGVYYAIAPVGSVGSGGSGAHIVTVGTEIDASYSSTGTVTVLVSGEAGVSVTTSLTAHNATRRKAVVGATGVVMKVGSQYWLTDVNHYPILCEATLSSDTHEFTSSATTGDSADQVATLTISGSLSSLSPYPHNLIPGTTPSIKNPRNLLGLSGDKILVSYNVGATAGDEWEIIDLFPATAREFVFELTADWPSGSHQVVTQTGVDVKILEGTRISGGIPTSFQLKDVYNLAVGSTTGAQGRAKYNFRTTRYDIVSMEKESGGDAHFLFTLTSAVTGASGTANVTTMAGTSVETGAAVSNTGGDFEGIPSGRQGICISQSGVYYITRVFEQHLTDVRWDDPDLEKTRDNAQTWDNVDTAQDCP